jgi:imidazolonepropionase-like amidohydrolase
MPVIFRDALVLDGKGDSFSRCFVVVENSQIVKVGKGPGPAKKKAHDIVDLEGRTLLPGIIDCHVHLCLDGSADPMRSLQSESEPVTTLKTARNAQLTLLAGVTTVRDMGARNGVTLPIRDAVAEGIVPGPRILSSGRCICMTGGHGWPFGREADGEDEVRKAVREQIKAGVDVIKLMATGGVITPGVDPGATQYTYEELKAGVEEAHKAGRRTAAHAQGNQGVKNALRAGIDSIEHGVFLDDEAIKLFLDSKTALIPTISAPFHILDKGIKGGVPAYAVEKTKKVSKTHIESAQRAYREGVTIAMGTDAGTPFNGHGENLKELELLVGIGLSPMEAISAATGIASQTLGLGNQIGTIERGKFADLIVIEGDPLKDISLLQNKEKLVIVMKEGRFHKKLI